MGPGFLRNHLVPFTLTHPTQSGKEGLLWTLLVKEFQLAESTKRAFSAVASMEYFAPRGSAFWKSVEIWLCQLAGRLKSTM